MDFPRLSSFVSKASTYFSDKLIKTGMRMHPNEVVLSDNLVTKAVAINPNKSAFSNNLMTKAIHINPDKAGFSDNMINRAVAIIPNQNASDTLISKAVQVSPGNEIIVSESLMNKALAINPDKMIQIENSVYERMTKSVPNRLKPPPRPDMFEAETVIPYPYAPAALELMIRYSPHLTTSVNRLNEEIFREDIQVLPNFSAKCDECGREFNEKPDQCDCGGAVHEPDIAQQDAGYNWLTKANPIDPYNDITTTNLFKMMERDVDVNDDAWIGLTKDYDVDPRGNILRADVVEIWKGPLERMRLIRDKRYRATGFDQSLGKGYYTCVLHRDNNLHEVPGLCPHCDRPMHAVVAVALDDTQQPGIGYIAGEVKHWSKFHLSETYGYSLMLVAWILENSILNMDLTTNITYREKRPYKGIMTFVTSNAESLKTAIEEEDDKVAQNPLHVPKIAIESNSNSGKAEFIAITPSFQELDMLAHRESYIRTLSAMWGVQPMFLGDLSQSGGLNNEGLQVTVTLHAVQFGHKTWHQEVFPWLQRQLGMTDYHFEFPTPIEKDKVAIQQRKSNNLDMIGRVLVMNGEIEIIDDEEFDFRIVGELSKPDPQGFGFDEGQGGKELGRNNNLESDRFEASMIKSYRGIDEEVDFRQDLMMEFNQIFNDIRKGFHEGQTQEDQKDLARSIVGQVRGRMENKLSGNYADLILRGFNDANLDPVKANIDIGSIKALAKNSPVWDSFKNLNKSLTGKFTEIISDAFAIPGEFSLENMLDRMKKASDVETFALKRIARTETNAVVNEGRTRAYKIRDPEGNFNYGLVGLFKPPRTCKAHMWLKSQIDGAGGAVSMKRMEQLHKTAFERFIKPENPTMTQRGFNIHINQITKIVRVVE